MNLVEGLTIFIAAIVAIWSIFQTRLTIRLEKEVQRLNTALNQSLQLLHRARETTIKQQEAEIFLLEYLRWTKDKDNAIDWILYANKHAELSAAKSELRGLGFAIGDESLLKLINSSVQMADEFAFSDGSGRAITHYEQYEMEVRGRAQKIHTRIAELIRMETENRT
jgi:hypothetical protein